MDRADQETQAFVLPGLLHQFGNLLLTIQGNALMLVPEAGGDRASGAQRAILGATQRGSHSLHIVRYLLGDESQPTGDPAQLLEQLAELVRIPLREAHQLFDLRLPAHRSFAQVLASEFVWLVVETLRRLVELVPNGGRGCVVLELAPGGAANGAQVRVWFEPTAGHLPFPLATNELANVVAARAVAMRSRATCRCDGQAVELRFVPPAVTDGVVGVKDRGSRSLEA